MPSTTIKTSLIAAALLARLVASSSGSGQTTRYWDCCKPSCAWPKAGLTSPVKVCDASNNPLADVNAKSGCEGGTAFMCSDQTPWAINDNLAYGFGAVSASGDPPCCACYKLTFTSTAIKGKQMIIQATNTGGDVSATQFDLAVRFSVVMYYLPTHKPPPAHVDFGVMASASPEERHQKGDTMTDDDGTIRSPAAASVSTTPALPNGKPPPPSGANSTVAPPRIPARNSPRR